MEDTLDANQTTMRIPNSPYYATACGEILDWTKKPVKLSTVDDVLTFEFDWIKGKRHYNAAALVLIAFHKVELPDEYFDEIEPLFKDSDSKNISLTNLVYRFKNGPLECAQHPGHYYIPFFNRYVINREGDVLSLKSGEKMSFLVAPPKRGKTSGYKYSRLIVLDGVSKLAGLHRLLCYTFKRYEADIFTLVVNHIDGITNNNSLDNLEIITAKENVRHAVRTGLKGSNVIPFLVYNLKDETITRYTNQKECAEILKIYYSTISHRLRTSYANPPDDGLVFKYDDGSAWPVFKNMRPIEQAHQNDRKILARNVFTGDIIKFQGMLTGQELFKIKAATIYAHVEFKKNIPYCGYNFRYANEDVVWPEHSARHLQIYRDYPEYPGDGVIVKDEVTGEEQFYTSKANAGIAYGVTEDTILSYVQHNKLASGRYRFSLLRIRDKNGPSYQ